MKELTTTEQITQKIFIIHGNKVMLDHDLAELYRVSAGRLNEAVKRNARRFPRDFMYVLTKQELIALRSQIAISKKGRGGRRYATRAFTKQGVAMLSSVLNSEHAIQVNIAIMRAFVKLRKFIAQNKEFAQKLNELERKVGEHDKEIAAIFEALHELMAIEEKPKGQIGFNANPQANKIDFFMKSKMGSGLENAKKVTSIKLCKLL